MMPCINSSSGLEHSLQDLKGGIDFDFFNDNVSSDYEYEKIMPKCDEKTNIKITVKAIVEDVRSNKNVKTQDEPTGNEQFTENVSVHKEKQCTDDNSEYAEIMKCIAYEDQQNERICNHKFESSLDISLSDSTPSSDLTVVTPLSCSSGSLNREFNIKEYVDVSVDDEFSETSSYEHKMTFLTKAIDDLDLCSRSNSQNVSSNIHELSNHYSGRKNMTFTNDQLRQIDRENDRLLKRIMSYSKPRNKPLSTVHNYQSRKTSAAINRARQQKQIERDNFILWKKIRNLADRKK